MTYNVNLPLPANKLRNFPGDITTNNWPRLYTVVNADHQFNLSSAANDGYHKVIHFVDQAAVTPPAVVGSGELYTKTKDTTQTLYYQEGGGREIQLTGPATTAGAQPYLTLPGGYILKGGTANVNPSGDTTINLTDVAFSQIYSVVITGVAPVGTPSNGIFLKDVFIDKFNVVNVSSTITSINFTVFGMQA